MLKDGLTDLMKQAQAMQGEVAKMQKEISALEVVGEAGGGMVKVRMNGRGSHAGRRSIDRSPRRCLKCGC